MPCAGRSGKNDSPRSSIGLFFVKRRCKIHLFLIARPVVRDTPATRIEPHHTMSDEVRASHLLVKHQGSRRPASWRDPDGQHIPKKTKEAARDELLAYREQIASGVVTFADLAAKVSDCSSAKHGGDLGFFGPGKMQKAFEVRHDAAAA